MIRSGSKPKHTNPFSEPHKNAEVVFLNCLNVESLKGFCCDLFKLGQTDEVRVGKM